MKHDNPDQLCFWPLHVLPPLEEEEVDIEEYKIVIEKRLGRTYDKKKIAKILADNIWKSLEGKYGHRS
jgi:hypothetical protein